MHAPTRQVRPVGPPSRVELMCRRLGRSVAIEHVAAAGVALALVLAQAFH